MVKAYIVIKEGLSVTEEEILNYCKSKLAVFKIPKAIEFRESLPKTAVGKVLRRFLVEEEREKMRVKEMAEMTVQGEIAVSI